MGLYLAICFGFILTQANEAKDLLPLLPVSLIACGILQKSKPHIFRSFYMSGESAWLAYGVLVGSTAFITSTAFVVGSIAISIYRHDLRPKLSALSIRERISFGYILVQRQKPTLTPLVASEKVPPTS